MKITFEEEELEEMFICDLIYDYGCGLDVNMGSILKILRDTVQKDDNIMGNIYFLMDPSPGHIFVKCSSAEDTEGPVYAICNIDKENFIIKKGLEIITVESVTFDNDNLKIIYETDKELHFNSVFDYSIVQGPYLEYLDFVTDAEGLDDSETEDLEDLEDLEDPSEG